MSNLQSVETSKDGDAMLEDTWNFIEPSIKLLLNNVNPSIPMSQVEKNCNLTLYMKVYTSVYNFCVERSRKVSNKEIENMNLLKNEPAQPKSHEILSGGDLYYKLEDFLMNYLKNLIASVQIDNSNKSTDFLNFYKKTYPKYVKVISSLDNIFDYMNRFWIESERSNGNNSVFKIYQLGLKCWRDIIYEPNENTIIDLTIKSCNEYRYLQLTHVVKLDDDSEDVNMDADVPDILKTCKDLKQRIYWSVNSSLMICIDASDLKRSTDALYNHFKVQFESNTFEFYKKFTQDVIDNKSLNYYVKFVNKIRIFEDENINALTKVYNHGTLHSVLDDVLVVNNFDRFLNTFGASYHAIISQIDLSIETDKLDLETSSDYQLIFCIWNSIRLHPHLVQQLGAFFGVCCTKFSCDKIATSVKQLDFQLYIMALLKLYELNIFLIKNITGNQTVFLKSFEASCKQFVNHNSFAQPEIKDISHQPEILAKYADMMLKKKNKKTEPLNFDLFVHNITTLFQFLEDKESFELEYRKLFTKRLIHGTTKGESYELKVISSLQQTNSLEYTGKISKMLQDITSSRAITESRDIIFEPSVVAKAMWPFDLEKEKPEDEAFDSNMTLPEEIKVIFEQFEAKYQEKHQGRVLSWLWSLSKTEIEANISKPGRPAFVFVLTIYQTIILLGLQKTNVVSLRQLTENFDIKYVIAHIIPFYKKKLITLIYQNGSPIENLSDLKRWDQISLKLNIPYKALNQSINFTIGVNVQLAEQLLNGVYHD